MNVLKLFGGKQTKIAVLKKAFEGCEGIYEVYRDIADTYYSIANGDYVSKLMVKDREIKEKNRKAKSL